MNTISLDNSFRIVASADWQRLGQQLLGCSAKDLEQARRRLRLNQSMPQIRDIGISIAPHELEAAIRIGTNAQRCAIKLLALERFWRGLTKDEASFQRNIIATFDDAVDWVADWLPHLTHEELWVLVLDGRQQLIAASAIGRGGSHGCAVTAADILRYGLQHQGSALIVIHNHPSGCSDPSEEDIAMTQTLIEACAVVGLPLLDHIIVSRNGASSLQDRLAFY